MIDLISNHDTMRRENRPCWGGLAKLKHTRDMKESEIKVGQKFGLWQVISKDRIKNLIFFSCKCECGTTKSVCSNSLKRGTSKSCGCQHKKDLTGMVIGLLTVICRSSDTGSGKVFYQCRCACGSLTKRRYDCLKYGLSWHCGCRKESRREAAITHGMTKTKEYKTWICMRERCNNSKSEEYINYGGRGIMVCERWSNSFENFFSDMGTKPTEKHSIDRIDNDGNYEPGNCR